MSISVLVALVILALVFLLALTAPPPNPTPLGIGFTSRQKGHIGDYRSDHFLVVMVTNTTPRQIELGPVPAQYVKVDGTTLTDWSNEWGGTNLGCHLAPGAVVPLPFEPRNKSGVLRVYFDYYGDAGFLTRATAPLVRALASHLHFTTSFKRRLDESGFMYGRLSFHYESPWQTNQMADAR